MRASVPMEHEKARGGEAAGSGKSIDAKAAGEPPEMRGTGRLTAALKANLPLRA